jgi:hypothetical protein
MVSQNVIVPSLFKTEKELLPEEGSGVEEAS